MKPSLLTLLKFQLNFELRHVSSGDKVLVQASEVLLCTTLLGGRAQLRCALPAYLWWEEPIGAL